MSRMQDSRRWEIYDVYELSTSSFGMLTRKTLEACRIRDPISSKARLAGSEAVSHDIVDRQGELEYTKQQTP